MKMRFEIDSNYCYLFNYNTGKNLTIEKSAFIMRHKGPNLLDVSITNRCNRCCDFCYRQSNVYGDDITLENYQLVLKNAKKCGVQQIAIGGGEPTLHPDFCEILKMTRESGIIPNYSTNGKNLSPDIIFYTEKYCGAIAISVYDEPYKYEELIQKISQFNIRLNLHFILRSDKIKDYTSILHNPPRWLKYINALIFLNYKPAQGYDYLCFKNTSAKEIENFFDAIKSFNACGIGFDTCSVSFICKYLDVESSLYDFCEAGRKSAYINEQLDVYPCSFYREGHDSLKDNSLYNIWHNSKTFNIHRNSLAHVNYDICTKSHICHSGCPIYNINLCNECRHTAL